MRDRLIEGMLEGVLDEEEFVRDLFTMGSWTVLGGVEGASEPGAWKMEGGWRAKWGWLMK